MLFYSIQKTKNALLCRILGLAYFYNTYIQGSVFYKFNNSQTTPTMALHDDIELKNEVSRTEENSDPPCGSVTDPLLIAAALRAAATFTASPPPVYDINPDTDCAFVIERPDIEPQVLQTLAQRYPNMASVRIAYELDEFTACGCLFPFGRFKVDDKVLNFARALGTIPTLKAAIMDTSCVHPSASVLVAGLASSSRTLTSIRIADAEFVTSDAFVSLGKCVTLLDIAVKHCPHLDQAAILAFSTLPDLNAISIDGATLENGTDFGRLNTCKSLRIMHFIHCNITSDAVTVLFSELQLRELWLIDSTQITPDAFAALGKSEDSMEAVSISRLPFVTDAVLDSLQLCGSLQTIHMLGCPRITDAGLTKYKKAKPRVTVHTGY